MTLSMVGGLTLLAHVASASGFKCDGDTHSVRLLNHVSPWGTRTPAVLVISSLEYGTLLVRYDENIRRHVRQNTIQYVVEGSRKLRAEKAILQIRFRDGHSTLASGEVAPGQLVLLADNRKTIEELDCERIPKRD